MLDAFTTAFVAFFVTIDPLGLVPLCVALTAAMGPGERRRTVDRALLVATLVLVPFVLVGEAVLTVLGISMPAFRVAGGLFLFLVALEMVFERRQERRDQAAGRQRAEEVAVFPLGIPLVAGPAAMTTAILVSERYAAIEGGRLMVLAALLLVLAVTWIAFRLAQHLHGLLGREPVAVLSRVLGLLLGALAAQYVLDGLRAAFAG